MIWTPPTQPLTRTALRREIRAILNDYAPTLPALDDAEIDRAADAIIAEWDAAEPLTTHLTIHSPATLMPGQRVLHAHDTDYSPIPFTTSNGIAETARYPATLIIAIPRALDATPTISVPAAAAHVTTAQLDPFTQYAPPAHVRLNTNAQWWTGSADAGEQILILHTEPAGTGIWTLLDALEVGSPCRAAFPPQHPTPHTLIHTPIGTYYYNGNTYTPAPPTTHTLDMRDMIHIAPRAAAWIILARTTQDHQAHDWAQRTLSQPYPGDRTPVSRPVTPRDDWIA